MNWKNWPYWVRGGVLAIGIALIPSLFGLLMIGAGGFLDPFSFFDDGGLGSIFEWTIMPYLIIASLVLEHVNIIYATAFYFVIGSIIGYLYGKFKNRNKLN